MPQQRNIKTGRNQIKRQSHLNLKSLIYLLFNLQMEITMTVPPPPPPPPTPSSSKIRPSDVSKYAMYMLVASILVLVFGIIDFFVWGPPANLVLGIIFVLLAVIFFIDTFGVYAGQSWALTLSGYSRSQWAQAPEVREFFGLPPVAFPGYVQAPIPTATPPPSPMCPTCGRPLTYMQQYNRWYCATEQKYV
jgi:hypothetical protein